MLERAIAIDPGPAVAYASLEIITLTDSINRWNGATTPRQSRTSRGTGYKAADMDDTEPLGHHAFSFTLDGAKDAAERAT